MSSLNLEIKFRRKSIYKHYKLTNLKATHICDLNNPKKLKLLHEMNLNNTYVFVVSMIVKSLILNVNENMSIQFTYCISSATLTINYKT